MPALSSPAQKQPSRLWRGVWRWLLLIPLVTFTIYLCSLSSHVGLGYPIPSEISSNIHATYAAWERINIQPVSTAIIQDLPEFQDISPEDLAQPGNVWSEPTVTPHPLLVNTATPTESAAQPIVQAFTPTSPPPLASIAAATSSPSPTITQTPRIATATITRTPTRTATLVFIATPTRTSLPYYTSTATSTLQAVPTPTLTVTSTRTPTLPPILTSTSTATITPTATPTATATHTATATPTPTITLTPTITKTPTITNTPAVTPTEPPCGGNIPSGEPDIGPPDGSFASLPCGGLLILDLPALGHEPIDLSTPDTAYDLVFYERRLPPPDSEIIELDWVSVYVGPGPSGACDTSAWYTGFNWGDGIVTNNGHLGSLFPEIDNQQIFTVDLWGTAPLQTGIAIDLDDSALGIPPGLYPCIRVISPFNYPDNDPSEVDALEILD